MVPLGCAWQVAPWQGGSAVCGCSAPLLACQALHGGDADVCMARGPMAEDAVLGGALLACLPLHACSPPPSACAPVLYVAHHLGVVHVAPAVPLARLLDAAPTSAAPAAQHHMLVTGVSLLVMFHCLLSPAAAPAPASCAGDPAALALECAALPCSAGSSSFELQRSGWA